MDDLLRDFLTETNESLAQLDVEIVNLEQNPDDPELISSIFRLVHTVKGTCGFLGLSRLEKLAHSGENVLGKFRDRELPVTPKAVTLILRSIDAIKSMLLVLEETEAEPAGDDSELIAALDAMAAGDVGDVEGCDVSSSSSSTAASGGAGGVQQQTLGGDSEPDEFGFVPIPAEKTAEVAAARATEKKAAPTASKEAATQQESGMKESAVSGQTIRVSVDQLENLMVIASELVLTRNQLMQISRTQKDNPFVAPLQRLNHVTSELQEGVMKTRMQPIGNAWSKLPRIVRDLSMELGKKIDLQMVGADTELDRQVLELIKDPLTHMVRNSADHGIEVSSDRLMAGKPETGVILLNAFHEGGHIIIEISDDGRGISLNAVKNKIVQNNLANESDVASMSDQQIIQYIFKPGFSTATKVTAVSGRGVGMDVVKTNIEKIGGTVDLQSVEGKGSRFLIKIPLTLAIVSALIVECAEERFAIPQISVVELVHASANSEYKVEYINQTPVLRLRNRLLPLVSLRRTLELGGDEKGVEDLAFIVVVQVGSSFFGIIVDRVFDTEEIVVKPVSPILRNISMFSGNTILGDGSVVMILDPNGVASCVGEIHDSASATSMHRTTTTHARGATKQSLLVFRAGVDAPKAVPLSLVARLEEIDLKTVEYSEEKPVVQYRGKLMPLVTIDGATRLKDEGSQPILVFSDHERSMGLVVDEIVDIIEDHLDVNLSAQRPGYIGSAIVAGKATDMVDTGYYLSQAYQNWFNSHQDESFGEEKSHRVLLVDDSPFFRNLLTPLLTVAGYTVTTAENPAQALKMREEGEEFDVIVSDIEMPGMSGFDFASTVRREGGKWSELPFIALSSYATPRDIERGRVAGFTDYVAKFNRDALLASLQQTLNDMRVAHD
ncbi:MAG: chemotaxis protein CheW [Alphaproteobacteria bacterium]|jgi:two-component system chemotaxis sensor kinase CheA|nr:chemotaxis protein CheW [Alphaproteobacteria bacterium]